MAHRPPRTRPVHGPANAVSKRWRGGAIQMSLVSTNAAGQAEVQADASFVDPPPGVLDRQAVAELVDGQRDQRQHHQQHNGQQGRAADLVQDVAPARQLEQYQDGPTIPSPGRSYSQAVWKKT